MAQVLCLDADTDLYSQYATAFRQKLLFSRFSTTWPQHSVIYLRGTQVVQPDVDNNIAANPPQYITGCGHGLPDTFTGFGRNQIWNAEQDMTLLQGMIVHLGSCDTGVALGPAMIRDGVRAFWGYTRGFHFGHENPPPKDRSSDTYAEVCLKMDCLIDEGVLHGDNGYTIYETVTEYFDNAYAELDGDFRQPWLLHNYECLVGPLGSYGDQTATI